MSCISVDNVYLIVGTGVTGRAVAEFLHQHKLSFFITDDNIDNLKKLSLNDCITEKCKLYTYDLAILREKHITHIVLSPTIHAQYNPHKIVRMSMELGIEIISDMDLFYESFKQFNLLHRTDKKIVAVTGTNGKSTVTALIAFICNKIGKPAIACGNIGVNVLSVDLDKYEIFVVEMSSYNLFLMKQMKIDVGVLLNISEDHLEYHGDMNRYIEAKTKVLEHAQNKIICIDDEYTSKIKCEATTVSVNNERANYYYRDDVFYRNGKKFFSGTFANLRGKHNITNILCCVAVMANLFDMNDNNKLAQIMNEVKMFHGLPHRIQFVRQKKGIIFINDSKGTNAVSTQKALQAFENCEIYLIAGGQRKTAGFLSLKNDLKDVKCVFLIGEATNSFATELSELGIDYKKCYTMESAVQEAFKEAILARNINVNSDKRDVLNKTMKNRKKIILLSPLCAGWDLYKNFEERGNNFIEYVQKL